MSRTTGSTGTPADNAVVESMFDETNPRSERPTRTMPARNQSHGGITTQAWQARPGTERTTCVKLTHYHEP